MKTKVTIIGAIAAFLLVFNASASALIFELNYEFDGILPVQNYGTVEVTEDGLGDLDFAISYNATSYPSPLGSNADIHEFYFNLNGDFPSLEITYMDTFINTPYSLGPNPQVAGGGGASFDWGINFGEGSQGDGNGILQSATFTLSADQNLLIDTLLEYSYPNNTPPVYFAVHFQRTSTDAGSETVGGSNGKPNPVPEPATMLLLGSGLIGFAAIGRKKFRKK